MPRQRSSSGSHSVPTEVPKDFPQTPPPPIDLYATSDIRFVMVKMGELIGKVDRLISDVEGHSKKIDALSHQATSIKAAVSAAVGVAVVFSGIIAWIFSAKWDAILAAIVTLQKGMNK